MRNMFLFLGLTIATINVLAQTVEKKVVYQKLDTIETYSLFLESGSRGFFVNGESVRKNVYDRYTVIGDRFLQCKPCILKVYSTENVLISVGTRYGDCSIGDYTECYPNGKIKTKGHYKQIDTGDWSNLSARGYCSVIDGEWRYYSQWGHLLRIELYTDGKLISKKEATE